MKGRQTYLGVVVVGVVMLLVALLGTSLREALLTAFTATNGLLLAVAGFALFAYRERRDPTLLLVGTAAGAVAIHTIVLSMSSIGWPDLLGRRGHAMLVVAPVAGALALLRALVVVVPWRDRRGQPPLESGRVVAAVVAVLVGVDVIVFVRPAIAEVSGTVPHLSAALILLLLAAFAGGIVTTVRSLRWGGRFGWIASAGLSLAFFGLGVILGAFVDGPRAVGIVDGWARAGLWLAAASLIAFVLASLRLESSRMRRATDRAAEVMEGRAEIAATIAHDVRGPVGTIKGLATTTRKSYDKLDDAQRVEFIGMIESESARLLRLVDQVAVGLKVDAGTLDLTRRLQEIAPLVRQAIERVEAGERTIQVDAPPDVRAAVDTRWFVEAVAQGLDNALRFSPEERAVRVEVRKGPDDGAIVTITDLGPGIPADQREAVFDKFVRWRPAGYEERQGAGLGLFICRGIARAHGGDATLDSPPAGGTMLRVRFPREGGG
ncbi:MAG TPA: HAMP domain-containing sensor histidine kinase [Actinomycetota bacterium]